MTAARMPDYLLLGAMKSATSSLAAALEQHPQIYSSRVKEANYFHIASGAKIDFGMERGPVRAIATLKDYQALFAGAPAHQRVGEATPTYLSSARAARVIREQIPAVRLFAILRNPADRTYSHFQMFQTQGKESRSFDEVIRDEKAGIDRQIAAEGAPTVDGGYLYIGLYARHLQIYRDLFPPEQLKVILFEDFTQRSQTTLADLCDFLGIDSTYQFGKPERSNETAVVSKPGLMAGLKRIRIGFVLRHLLPKSLFRQVRQAGLSRLTVKPQPMSPESRATLVTFYRPEILRLQDMLDRDLTHWLEG